MRNEGVRNRGVVVNNLAEFAGRVLVEESERRTHQFFHGKPTQVSFEPECYQVRAGEGRKVEQNACDRGENRSDGVVENLDVCHVAARDNLADNQPHQ